MSDVEKINCEKALRHLLEYIDQEVTGELKQQMAEHMASCRSCFSRLEFEKTLKSHVQDTGCESAPDSLRRKIDGLLKEFGK